jgi:hypothetical protein
MPPRTASLQGARLTRCGPVAAQHLASFLGREPIGQPLAGRTAIDIVRRNVDEVLLAETAWQALAVFELLDDLRNQIRAHYGVQLFEISREQHLHASTDDVTDTELDDQSF